MPIEQRRQVHERMLVAKSRRGNFTAGWRLNCFFEQQVLSHLALRTTGRDASHYPKTEFSNSKVRPFRTALMRTPRRDQDVFQTREAPHPVEHVINVCVVPGERRDLTLPGRLSFGLLR